MPEVLEASLKLGLPMVMLSWLVFSKLYREGRLEVDANRKEAEAALKAQRKEKKANPSASSTEKDALFDKWMWLGGGFYGLAGLWTLLIVEVTDITRFIVGLPQFVQSFDGGIFDLVKMFIANQLSNLVAAFAWFTYWADGKFIAYWMLVAYLGYLAGMQLAKRKDLVEVTKTLIKRPQ